MRFREFRPLMEDGLGPDAGPDMDANPIEDEAESRGDAALITALEFLRNQAAESGAVTPRVKVDTVIDRVRAIPGNEQFNYASLDKAKNDNDTVKNMIKNIDDDPKTGAKYVYLTPPESEVDNTEGGMGDGGSIDSDKANNIVSKMAKHAASS